MTDSTSDASEADPLGHTRPVVLSWAELVLDSDNPRLEDGGDSNRETLNALLDSDTEKQIAITRSISSSGQLNPLDLIGVVSDGETFVVVEGNRRIAALKMLKSPELINDMRVRRRIEKIAEAGTGPDDVTCTQFSDRDEARQWILLRHRGEQDGRGVVAWTPDMQERYSRDPGSQSDLARQAREIMLSAYPEDTELEHELDVVFRGGEASSGRRVRARPTTLGRLLKATQVQQAFGFVVENGEIAFFADPADVHAAFRQMIFDVSEGLTARDINNSDQITRYIQRYPDLHFTPPPSAPGPTTGSSQAGGVSSSRSTGGSATTGGAPTPASPQPSAPAPTRRRVPREERKIFEGLRLTKFDRRTSKTLKEAQQLHIDQVPAVAGVMIRVIVELCVTEAIGPLNLNIRESDSLRRKIGAVLKQLDPNIENSRQRGKTLEAAWINSQMTSGDGLGVDLMNAFVHGLNKSAAPSEVRSLSKDYRPMLERLDNEMP